MIADPDGWIEIRLPRARWQCVQHLRSINGLHGEVHLIDEGGVKIKARCENELDAALLSLWT
jgi:hypothetical protein